ncbi:hypothetical protein [Desulforhopalus sp. 52FAK]
MKNRLISALAMAFIVASSVTPVWASTSNAELEEECQLMAFEQNIPEEDIEQFIADCLMSVPVVEDNENGQEEVEQIVTLDEECRSWGLELQIPDDEIEQFVKDCVEAEIEAQEQEPETEQPVQE